MAARVAAALSELMGGTGTGSVVAALMRRGLVSGENTKVHVPGGELFITLNTDPQTQEITDIYLTGPTNIVAEGEVCDEELILYRVVS